MKVKVLTQEEYEKLKEEVPSDNIVTELGVLMLSNNLVVVEQPDGTYKVISARDTTEKLGLIVTKDQLHSYIFMAGI